MERRRKKWRKKSKDVRGEREQEEESKEGKREGMKDVAASGVQLQEDFKDSEEDREHSSYTFFSQDVEEQTTGTPWALQRRGIHTW